MLPLDITKDPRNHDDGIARESGREMAAAFRHLQEGRGDMAILGLFGVDQRRSGP
jgi:hypothetical protein